MEIKTVDCALELEEIMNANQIVATGSQFWKRVMQEVHNKIMHNVMNEQMQRLVKEPDERPIVTAKQNALPRLSWKEDALVIHAIPQMDLIKEDKSAISDLFINLDIALKCGLVVEKTSQNRTWYPLGPNMQYTLPTKTYDSTTQPTGSQFRTAYNWEGEQYMGVNPTLLFGNTGSIVNDPLQVVTHGGVKFFSIVLDGGMAVE